MSKWGIVALLTVALAPMTMAQMHGGGGRFGPGFGFSGNRPRSFGGRSLVFGDPFWYSDYPSGSLADEVPSPPAGLQRRSMPTAPERKTEPLLIEWQGDRFVRFGGVSSDRTSPDYSETASLHTTNFQAKAVPAAAHTETPPAVLIFRDGHQERVSDYVITRGVLYAQANYAETGSWTHNIQLASLDLSATLKANQENGVRFVLPAGPNEVVTRP